MKYLIQYFLLETKKFFLQLPKLLFGSVLLLAIIFTCIFLVRSNIMESENRKPVFIGVLAEKEEPFIDWIIKTANQMPDMGYSFHIERIDSKDADDHFFDDDSHVLFMVPKNYISSIIEGRNDHLTIRFSKSQTTIVNTLLKELADAASSYILTTEGAIYSMQDYYKKYALPDEPKEELLLNIKYVQEIINFTDAVETVSPDSESENSLVMICLAVGIVLVPLVSGLLLAPVLTSENQIKDHLIRFKIYLWKQSFIRLLIFLFALFSIFFSFSLIFFVFQKMNAGKILEIFPGGTIFSESPGIFFLLLSCIPVFLFAASFSLFIFELSGDALGGTLLLFFTVTFMALFSGLFYPVSYLPGFFQKITGLFPTTHAKNYVLALFYHRLDTKSFLSLWIYSGIFYLLTVLVSKLRKELYL